MIRSLAVRPWSLLGQPSFMLVLLPSLLLAQTPTPAPPVLQIFEETLRPGHAGLHARTEMAWPLAFARAKVPAHYLAMSSQTGPARMWFLSGWASLAELESVDEAIAKAPGLPEELDRIGALDAEHVEGGRTLIAVHRPDLSFDGLGNDLAKMRYMEVAMYRVRPGQELAFARLAQEYGEMARTGSVPTSWATYEIRWGMGAPTFLVLSGRASLAELDQTAPEALGWQKVMTAARMTKLMAEASAVIASAESQLFRFAPKMSYLPADWIARDPAYWQAP